MKIDRLQRVLKLITILQSGRYYSADELAQLLSVTTRTIFRDFSMLHRAGIPYYHDDQLGGYKMDPSFFLPPVNLQLPEALALLMLAQHGASPHGLPLQQQAHQAALKIESALPPHIQQHCRPILQRTSVRLPARARHLHLDQTFALLQNAVAKRRKVKITYVSFHEKKQIKTTLSPYHLHFAQRAWYLIGHSSLHKQDRIFKLGRMKNVEMLPSIYLRDKPFSIEQFLGNAWSLIPEGKDYNVELLFSPTVAGNVAEVLWHPTQKITWHDDGSITFCATVDGLTEIAWWIAGYADQVEVIKPALLRRKITQMAQKTAAIYKQQST